MPKSSFNSRHNACRRFMPQLVESVVLDGIEVARRDFRKTMQHLEECSSCLQKYQDDVKGFRARHDRCQQDMATFIDMSLYADDVPAALDRFGHVVDHLTECSFCSETFNMTMTAVVSSQEGDRGATMLGRYLARLISIFKKL